MKIIKKKFRINLIVQLAIIFIISLLFGDSIPTHIKSICFAISSTLKEVLLFVLPFIIFSCLFHSLVINQRRAVKFVILLLLFVCLSNFLSIFYTYGAISLGFSNEEILALGGDGATLSSPSSPPSPSSSLTPSSPATSTTTDALAPFWNLKLPSWIPNEIALILGLSLGLIFALCRYKPAYTLSEKLNTAVLFFLQKIFIPLLPLFALGFILKMQHEGILLRVVQTYGPIIILITLANILYSLLLFLIAAKFSIKVWWQYLKNIIPVAALGFSTMSSLATMPVTLNAAEKNTQNPELSRAIIPATVNIHMLGDSITIPIIVVTVLLTFNFPMLTFKSYMLFLYFFLIAKFSAPGVPGGTILVVLPALENYFGFSSEMLALATALYILFDPITTTFNVLGNSAFVIMLTRIMRFSPRQFFKKKEKVLSS